MMQKWIVFMMASFCVYAQTVRTGSDGRTLPPVVPTAVATPTPTIAESSVVESFGGASTPDDDEDLPAELAATEETPASSSAPRTYEIVKGDTLWDICKKILGDPWYWPKLWSINDYISNPHLIYPGSIIKFYAGSETATPSLTIEGAGSKAPAAAASEVLPQVEEPKISIDKSLANMVTKKDFLRLRPVTYVDRRKPTPLGKISHSGLPKVELTLGESVYLEFYKKMKISIGDKFHVYENIQEVFDPERTMKSYGWMIRKNAVLEIVKMTSTSIEARIISGDRSVKRGDEFVAYVSELRDVKPIDAKKTIAGVIIASENQQILIGQNHYSFINVGKSAGVKEGMRFYVVKQGDGLFQSGDEHLPDIIIGSGVIAEVFDHTSTLYISNLKETLEVGFQVKSLVK